MKWGKLFKKPSNKEITAATLNPVNSNSNNIAKSAVSYTYNIVSVLFENKSLVTSETYTMQENNIKILNYINSDIRLFKIKSIKLEGSQNALEQRLIGKYVLFSDIASEENNWKPYLELKQINNIIYNPVVYL